MIILETERLCLREMDRADFSALCKILQDEAVMYAYEHAFDREEVQQWLDRQINRYDQDGYGLWAVDLKATGTMIGQCGLTLQSYDGKEVIEIGYLLQKAFWHYGYAREAAVACRQYAFDHLNATEVYSIIRDTNVPSQNVAKANGMEIRDRLTKHYYGMEMPHLVYSVRRGEEL